MCEDSFTKKIPTSRTVISYEFDRQILTRKGYYLINSLKIKNYLINLVSPSIVIFPSLTHFIQHQEKLGF